MQRLPIALCALALNAGLAACGQQPEPLQTGAVSPEKSTIPVEQAPAPKVSPQMQLAADMELSGKVKQALEEPVRGHVEVAAFDGVITLYGTVVEPSDRNRIALLAMNVEGVRSVINNLVLVRGS